MSRSLPSRNGSAPDAPLGQAWSQRVGGLATLPALIWQLGADPVALLAGAGLAPDALDRADGRVPYDAVGRLLRDSAMATGCAHLGLLAGRMWRLGDLGLVGELARNCETVGEALEALVVHQHLNSGGGLAFLIERGGVVDLGYAIYCPGTVGTDQIYDCALAGAFNYLRELCGPGWLPCDAFLPHSRSADAGYYRNLFRVRPRFDAEFCALRFPASWMERPIAGWDPERRRRAQERVDRACRGELLEQVYRGLRVLLLHGKYAGDDLAQMMSMHRRTLNRRLEDAGTTFRKALDDVRFELARQLLADSGITLDDIAATLGYAGVSPFMRSFRRWAGTTPARWRRAAAANRARAAVTGRQPSFRPANPEEETKHARSLAAS